MEACIAWGAILDGVDHRDPFYAAIARTPFIGSTQATPTAAGVQAILLLAQYASSIMGNPAQAVGLMTIASRQVAAMGNTLPNSLMAAHAWLRITICCDSYPPPVVNAARMDAPSAAQFLAAVNATCYGFLRAHLGSLPLSPASSRVVHGGGTRALSGFVAKQAAAVPHDAAQAWLDAVLHLQSRLRSGALRGSDSSNLEPFLSLSSAFVSAVAAVQAMTGLSNLPIAIARARQSFEEVRVRIQLAACLPLLCTHNVASAPSLPLLLLRT